MTPPIANNILEPRWYISASVSHDLLRGDANPDTKESHFNPPPKYVSGLTSLELQLRFQESRVDAQAD